MEQLDHRQDAVDDWFTDAAESDPDDRHPRVEADTPQHLSTELAEIDLDEFDLDQDYPRR